MKRKLLFVIIMLVLLTAVISLSTASAAEPAAPWAQSAIDPRFGAVESFWAPSEAAQLGVGWERILFYWNEIQPTGPGDWNTLHVPEEWLNEAAAQGRQVVGLLKNTPNWATEGQFAAGVPNGLYLPIDDPANLWANYVRQVTAYYGQRGVKNWIVWNEPDIAPNVYGHEFSGSIQDYYQLVKVAYQVIKQVDPSARVHLGGMTYWHDPTYLNRYLQVVAADPEAAANNYYFDAISLHIYFRPETVGTIVGNAFYVQQINGISPMKEVWINETNARPSMDPEWPVQVQSFEIDLEQQAWYIVQAFSIGFYSGAARMSVYKLVDINMSPGDESWGLVRPYDFSKRPAFFAYQNTIKYLSGFTYPIQREQGQNYYIFTFNRANGTTTRVLWARNPAAVSLQVPALAAQGILVDPVTGTETAVTPVGGRYEINLSGARCHGECYMGGAPVFLVEESGVSGSVPTAVPSVVAQPPATTIAPTAVLTSTVTAAPTLPPPTPTSTPTTTATSSPTPSPTVTASPTETATPTSSPTATATTLPVETATSTPAATTEEPAATAVAALPPTPQPESSPASAAEEPILGVIPARLASWFFVGAGLLLAAGLGWLWRRQPMRQSDAQ